MAELLGPALGVPSEQIHVIADRYGNLGSPAIWIALNDLRRSGFLDPGHKVLVLGAEATKFLYGGFVYTH
jgi:3-oxoacyl-[acyl-carrier-protein] synthase-3